jgi:hypothetical protein
MRSELGKNTWIYDSDLKKMPPRKIRIREILILLRSYFITKYK